MRFEGLVNVQMLVMFNSMTPGVPGDRTRVLACVFFSARTEDCERTQHGCAFLALLVFREVPGVVCMFQVRVACVFVIFAVELSWCRFSFPEQTCWSSRVSHCRFRIRSSSRSS